MSAKNKKKLFIYKMISGHRVLWCQTKQYNNQTYTYIHAYIYVVIIYDENNRIKCIWLTDYILKLAATGRSPSTVSCRPHIMQLTSTRTPHVSSSNAFICQQVTMSTRHAAISRHSHIHIEHTYTHTCETNIVPCLFLYNTPSYIHINAILCFVFIHTNAYICITSHTHTRITMN